MRMHMRRLTWLTNAFSKKVENHVHSLALFTTCYNSFGSIVAHEPGHGGGRE